MKNRWRAKMKEAGKDIYRPGPNIVMGANAQVALEKFARYFDVEARLVPVTKEVRPFPGTWTGEQGSGGARIGWA